MIKPSKFAGIVNSGITKSRNNKFDNVRFFLMFFVLLGHGLELFEGETKYLIYRVIYTFHMPAFALLPVILLVLISEKFFDHFYYPI